MSQWLKVKTEIKDINTFFRVCTNSGVEVKPSHVGETTWGEFTLSYEGSDASLTLEGNSYRLSYDQDPHYSNFAKRFGPNGGTLLRDYAKEMVLAQEAASLIQEEELPDGSIRLLLAVAGG